MRTIKTDVLVQAGRLVGAKNFSPLHEVVGIKEAEHPADAVKKMQKLPESVLRPMTAEKFRVFRKDDLHERQRTMRI